MLLFDLVQPDTATAYSPAAVTATIQAFTNFLLRYLVALAAVGAFSMALIEAVKTLIDARTWFQTRRWLKWMNAATFAQAAFLVRSNEEHEKEKPLAELLQISTALSKADALAAARRLLGGKGRFPGLFGWWRDPSHALFALDLPKMMGSVQDAADVALNAPDKYPAFYLLMVSGADSDDVSAWHRDANKLIGASGPQPSVEERTQIKNRADVYARLKQFIKRKLDTFQLDTNDRWTTGNQLVANIAGAVTLYFVLVYIDMHHVPGAGRRLDPVEILVLSALGGILAPVAKDLVSTLKRVKDG